MVERGGLLGLMLASGLVLACKDEPPEQHEVAPALHDGLGVVELRSTARDGLDAALDDPALARELERSFADLLARPTVVDASEKLLARLAAAPELEAPTQRFFESVQASEGMRAALTEYARDNPELEIDRLAEGFVSHVDARLTRPELAALVREALTRRLGAAGPALGRALLIEAEGAEQLADHVAQVLVDPANRAALEQRIGTDPSTRRDRLHQRLRDPERMIDVLLALAVHLRDPAGETLLSEVLDDEAIVAYFADALARVLDDAEFRTQAETLFSLALASELDAPGVRRELDVLLDLPVIEREAAVLLAAIGRDESVRTRVRGFLEQLGKAAELEGKVLDAVD